MEKISELLNSPISWFIIWILIAVSNHQLGELLAKLSDFLESPLKSLSNGLENLVTGTKRANDSGKDFVEEMKDIIVKALDDISNALTSSIDPIYKYVNLVVEKVAPEEKRVWRLFGSLIQLAGLGLFVYADMVQGANNLSTLFPTIIVPGYLRDITYSLLIASVGVAVALGILLSDILGFTHFTPTENIQGKWKIVYLAIIGLTILLAFTFSTILALSRVTELVKSLDDVTRDTLLRNASYAQSLVIIPLLITTLLLYWGAVGLLVIICGLLLTFAAILRTTRFLLQFLKNVVKWGGVSVEFIFLIFFGFVEFAVKTLSLIFLIFVGMVSGFITVIQFLLNVIVRPPQLAAEIFIKAVGFLISFVKPGSTQT